MLLNNLFTLSIAIVFCVGICADSDCPEGWIYCGNGKCVSQIWVCDGDDDCGNSQDEVNCESGTRRPACLDSEFECRDGTCIPNLWHCDGENDCADGFDEKNCHSGTRKCDDSLFKCGDGACIPERWHCDGRNDCRDGSDEQSCRNVCAEHMCSHMCRLTPEGPECYCNHGFMLDKDNKTCIDIDECRIGGTCSQVCTNLIGSYNCSCIDGYAADNTTCRAIGVEPILLFSTKEEIKGLNLRTKSYFPVLKAVKQVSVLDIDPFENRVYWIEPSYSSTVYSSKMNGSEMKVVLDFVLMVPEDIAVDYKARNLYITDSGLKQVLVCKMEGSMCHVLHNLNITNLPRSIALDLAEGFIYWTDWGKSSSGIYRSGMDGSRLSVLVSKDIEWPNGITIDHTTKHLYWIDAKLQRIEYITLDGKKRKILLQEEIYHPYSLSVFEDNLYWSDWATHSLKTCHKFTPHKTTTVVERENHKLIFGVHVYHPVQAKRMDNPCWENTCSHMCLVAPSNGYKCACPPGFTLASNGATCRLEDSLPVLIVNNESSVYKIKPEAVGSTSLTELFHTHIDKFSRTAYDWKRKALYVADMSTPAISAVNTSTFAKRDLVRSNLVQPQDLAFDSKSENLYWVDFIKGTVEVISTKSNLRTSLIVDLIGPSAIALVPEIGRMFVSTISEESVISMYNMDGNNRVDLVLRQPSVVSLAVHPSESLLYWADNQTESISYLDYNKPKETTVLLRRLDHVTSVAVSDKYVYWTEAKNNVLNYRSHNVSIQRTMTLPLSGLQNDFIPRNVFFSLIPLRSFDSPCSVNNGGCSHLCLTAKGGRTCACPTGMMLSNDRANCTSENRCFDNKCQHLCVPNHSGSSCKCSDGYEFVNSTCSLISTKTDQVHEAPTTVDTKEHLGPTSTAVTELKLKHIFGKHFLPVMIGKRDDNI